METVLLLVVVSRSFSRSLAYFPPPPPHFSTLLPRSYVLQRTNSDRNRLVLGRRDHRGVQHLSLRVGRKPREEGEGGGGEL